MKHENKVAYLRDIKYFFTYSKTIKETESVMITENCLSKIKQIYNIFSKTEKRIAKFVLKNSEKVIYMTISDFALKCKVSKASVIRFYTKLDMKGYQEFKVAIAMDTATNNQAIYAKSENKEDLDHLLEDVTNENIKTLTDSLSVINRKNIKKASDLLLNADKVEIFGNGPSWFTAAITKCKLSKLNLQCNATQDLYFQCISATNLGKNSVAILISFSGQTPIAEAIAIAKEKGTKVIAISNYEDTQITSIADVVLLTSTTESPMRDGELTTIMGQLNVIDMLYTLMAMKIGDNHQQHLKRINEVTFKVFQK